MLVRAARRNARPPPHRAYKAAYEQLYLPWLCPSFSNARSIVSRSINIESGRPDPTSRRRRNSRDGSREPALRRTLATHVDRPFESTIEHSYSVLDAIPFDHSTPLDTFPSNTILKPWDPSQALLLSDSLAATPQRYRVTNAIGGEPREILAVLEACLQVGRIERAAVIIKRLISLDALSEHELLAVHNQFLQSSLNKVISHSSRSAAQAMHKWFEMEIKDKELNFTAEILAYMIKASLQSPPGGRRDRLIRRYMGMAPGEMGLEILSDGMFTAEDLHDITSITQKYNYTKEDTAPFEQPETTETLATALESRQAVIESELVIPEVRSTDQKGSGLRSLKQSLDLLIKKEPGFSADRLGPEEMKNRQMQIERDAVAAAVDRWRDDNANLVKMGLDTTLQTKSIGSRMWKWHCKLTTALEEEIAKLEETESNATNSSQADNERCIYGPFLRYLSVEKTAAVTILTCMSTLSSQGIEKGMPLSNVIMSIAGALEEEVTSERLIGKDGKIQWGTVAPSDRASTLARQFWKKSGSIQQSYLAKSMSKTAKPLPFNDETDALDFSKVDTQWSSGIKAKVGAFLLSALIDTAKVPVTKVSQTTGELMTQMQPAFTHGYQYKMGKKQGVVFTNSVIVQQMKREPVHSLLAKHLPMVVTPEPWSEFNKGGFLLHPAKMVRIKHGDKDQRHYSEAAIANGDMELMFKGLDVLGKTSWVINRPVFDVMLEAWNRGEGIANLPPAEPDLKAPPEPEQSQDPTTRRKWLRDIKKIENLRGSLHSQRCYQNFQLEIARALRDETFYFPHNLDFRGRAYPIPPYLNHMGADNCRGLLKFGVGKELGNNGLKWLKVHLANVFGFDKASLSEREAFASEHLKEIYDSVADPLGGGRWWLKAEDPWQCLAACHELKDALEAPDHTKFVSHLPIHQDGTCNGLQHYAALGGDEWGAKQVNLEPGDRPADVYTAVANLVKERIQEDKIKGHKFAEYLHGKITRKVVKQTVMTNVYGVTFIGAKAQVRKQLVAAYPDMPNNDEINPDYLASYIATKIFGALSTMFKGAHDIQYWLGDCANRISMILTPEQMNLIQANLDKIAKLNEGSTKSKKAKPEFDLNEHLQFKSSVVWTNPLRMPIVQPYRTSKARVIMTNMQRISIAEPHRADPISKRKQLQGFPPNFVHSLDATHMMLSALECDNLGLSFAAVHDSFWTHAGDVEAMNNVLRDAFIRIHTDDVIGRLAAEFKARYKGAVYLAKINPKSRFGEALTEWRKGSKRVGKSKSEAGDVYGIKKIKLRELLDERERLALLASSDPKDREKAAEIMTAASILENLGEEGRKDCFAKSSEDEPVTMGDMSRVESFVDDDLDSHADEVVFDNAIEDVQKDEGSVGVETDGNVASRTGNFKVHSKSRTFENAMGPKTKTTKRPRTATPLWAWLPLEFPDIPEKGSFDVRRLKNSQYFFS